MFDMAARSWSDAAEMRRCTWPLLGLMILAACTSASAPPPIATPRSTMSKVSIIAGVCHEILLAYEDFHAAGPLSPTTVETLDPQLTAIGSQMLTYANNAPDRQEGWSGLQVAQATQAITAYGSEEIDGVSNAMYEAAKAYHAYNEQYCFTPVLHPNTAASPSP